MSKPICNYVQTEIQNVYDKRSSYNVYPPCQRQFVWQKTLKQRLVDSILRGLPIPPIMLLLEVDDDLIGERWWIVDGQQRLKTIIQFREEGFETAKQFADEPFVIPLEPGRKYSELSPAAQSRFNNYLIQFCRVSGVNDVETGLIYRRFQYQKPLTFAEKMYSYDTKTKELAIMLSGHGCWKNLYTGNDERKQLFQLGVHLLLMETKNIFCNQQTPRLNEMAHNYRDISRSEGLRLTRSINRNLSAAEHLFDKATFSQILQFIPIYQAVLLLQEAGFDLARSQRGCLALWFMEVRDKATDKGNMFLQLTAANKQRTFWSQELERIMTIPGLVRPDKKRAFSEPDRIVAWLRQGGKCAWCKKDLHFREAIGNHLIDHARGGGTIPDNCQAMHEQCHIEAHSSHAKQNIDTDSDS